MLYAEPKKYPFIYLRSSGKNKILVALNPSRKSVTASFKLPGVDAFAELKMVEGIRLKENKGVFFLKMKEQAYGIFKF